MSGFEEQELYQAARRLIRHVDACADRYPDDEREALHRPVRDRTLEIGARIASGFSCLGAGGGGFPEEARRQIRALLAECRHYMLTAADAHMIDPDSLATFDGIHDELMEALDAAGGGPAAGGAA